jgi:F-type H+-transporting ATPase subunit epsilon
MAKTFTLSVVAPDRSILDEEPVTSLIAPGVEGYFGVMAGHTPLIASLRPGLIEFLTAENQRQFVAVGGGFVEVTHTKVTVLADSAERTEEIDLAEAEAELEEARRALRGESSELTTDEATTALERAMTRVRAARMAQRG